MSAGPLLEFAVWLMLEPMIPTRLLLGSTGREGSRGQAIGYELFHHGILAVRILGW